MELVIYVVSDGQVDFCNVLSASTTIVKIYK